MNRDNQIFDLIAQEADRQEYGIELIASENFTSKQVMEAQGSCLTNKYAEGLPGKRYYGGCEVVDQVEDIARERLKKIFGAVWCNVQPHSGASANAAVYFACLKPGDTVLGLDLSNGGHLTHGSPVNFSGRDYNAIHYTVNDEGVIEMDAVEALAVEHKPKMIICGASAYSREWDYKRFREIADKVGAVLLCDMSHPAGLIAAGILDNPVPHCHIVTTTTHKTLRGPRGGVIMIGEDIDNPWGYKTMKGEIKKLSQVLDGAVFPGQQGGPLEHVIAAKAIAFGEILTDEFKAYGKQIVANAQAMAKAFIAKDYKVISGGTDNHLMLIDLRNKGISGKKAERVLNEAHITLNKNMVPKDDKSPFVTSGIRVGVPAVTTRGMKEADMEKIVEWMDRIITDSDNEATIATVKEEVHAYMANFPLYKTTVEA